MTTPLLGIDVLTHVALEADMRPQEEVLWRGARWPTIKPLDSRHWAPFRPTFDEAFETLNAWPGLTLEPDGAFLWARRTAPGWQLEGSLLDREGRIFHVELWGNCERNSFAQLLDFLRPEQGMIVFELKAAALFVAESDFLAQSLQSDFP